MLALVRQTQILDMNPRLLTLVVAAAALAAASAPLAQARPDGVRIEGAKAIAKEALPEERIVTIMSVPVVPDGNTTTTSTEPSTTSTEALEANVTLAAPPPLQILQNSSNAKVTYPSEDTTAKLDLAMSSSSRPLEIHDFSAAPEVKFGEGHHSFDESLIMRNNGNQVTEAAAETTNAQEDPKAPSVLVAEEKVVMSTVSSREDASGENKDSTVRNVQSEAVTPLAELDDLEGDHGPIIIHPTVKSTVEPILVPVKIPLVCPSCGRMSLYHPGEEPCACQHCGCDMSDQHGGVTSHVDAGMPGKTEFYRMGNSGHHQTAASPFQVYQSGNSFQMQGAFQNPNPSGHESMEVRMVPLKADYDFRTKNLLKLRTDVDNLRSYKEAIGVPKGQLKLIANYKYGEDRQGTGKLPAPPAIPMAPVMYTMQLPNFQHQSSVRPTERPFEGSAGDDQQSKWKWFFSFPSWFWGSKTAEQEQAPAEELQEPSQPPKPLYVQPQPQVLPQADQIQAKPPRAPQQFQIPIQSKPSAVQSTFQATNGQQSQAVRPPAQPQPVRQTVQPQQQQEQQQSAKPEQRPQPQQQQQSARPEQSPQLQQQQVQQQSARPEQRPQPQQQQQSARPEQHPQLQQQQQSARPEQRPQLQQQQVQPQTVSEQRPLFQQQQQQPQVPQQTLKTPEPQQQKVQQQVPQQQQRPEQPQPVSQQLPRQPEKQQQPQVPPPQQPLKTPEQPPQGPQQQRPVVQQQYQAPQQQQQPKAATAQTFGSTSPNSALPAGGSATPVQVIPQQRLPQRTYYRREAGDVVVGPPYRIYHPELRAALKLLNDPYEQFQN